MADVGGGSPYNGSVRRRPGGPAGLTGIRPSHNSVDLSSFDSPLIHRTRPSSEIFLHTPLKYGSGLDQASSVPGSSGLNYNSASGHPVGGNATPAPEGDFAAEKWLQDLELYQQTLEDMATVSLDRNFKDELNAIEQWFEVLSEGERTAALYALLQQTTPVQIRFFITVLQKLAVRDPYAGALSPTESSTISPTNLDPQQLSQAAAAVAGAPASASGARPLSQNPLFKNVQSSQSAQSPFMTPPPKPFGAPGQRSSLGPPPPRSPWASAPGSEINRPKSASGGSGIVSTAAYNGQPTNPAGVPITTTSATGMVDYLPEGVTSWASVTNTPAGASPQASTFRISNEIASSTAIKLAALNTASSRAPLDMDVKKFRRRGSVITDEAQKYIEREMSAMALQQQQASPSQSQFHPTPGHHHSNSTSSPNSWGLGVSINSAGNPASPPRLPERSPSRIHTPSKKDKPEINYADPSLLADTAGWLRALRLHKYTDNLADLNWRQLVCLSDEQLQARGVQALGARRKMLKLFEQIRDEHGLIQNEGE